MLDALKCKKIQIVTVKLMGAPVGNTNGKRGSDWRDAIRYELARIGRELDGDDPAYKKGLRECAKGVIEAARAGEQWALKELGDRTDGRPSQSIEMELEASIEVQDPITKEEAQAINAALDEEY